MDVRIVDDRISWVDLCLVDCVDHDRVWIFWAEMAGMGEDFYFSAFSLTRDHV